MKIQVDIKRRVQWISDRVDLSDIAKDYISFQIKEAVTQALNQIQNIEKEIVVSDSPTVEHGVYKVVGDSHASGEPTTESENTNGATLEIITSDENICSCDWDIPIGGDDTKDGHCGYCGKPYE